MKNVELIGYLGEKDAGLSSVYLKGSGVRPESMDLWSDTDLLIVTEREKSVGDYIGILDGYFSSCEGKQVFVGGDEIVYRVVGSKEREIERFDIQVIGREIWDDKRKEIKGEMKLLYGVDLFFLPEEQAQHDYPFHLDQSHIENIWFLFYECLKKLARKDNLVGSHLYLELIRELLVFEMMKRDRDEGTNIHRFGKNEVLDSDIDCTFLVQSDNLEAKLEKVRELARVIDDILCEEQKGYSSRIACFERHVDESLKAVQKDEI